jgi:hypothetical protein
MRNSAAFSVNLCLLVLVGSGYTPVIAAEEGDTVAEITQLLDWFLAPENNPRLSTHQRFWADDLVYTRSTGLVRTKPEILASLKSDSSPADDTRWSAVDVLVRPYGDAAALTFRLIGRASDGSITQYRNSAMFLKRDSEWRAVTWQATRITDPPPP